MRSLNMAVITEHVEFSQFVKGVKFLSIKEADVSGNVVTTYSTRSISIVKLDDQKTIHSWSIRHGQRVTSPCVWCKQREEFMAVVNNREILTWKKEETSLDKIKRKALKFRIHQVFCVQEYEPLVLCSNGAVDFLSNVKNTESSGLLSESDIITWCHAVTVGGMLCVLYLVKKQNEELQLVFNRYEEANSAWFNASVDVLKPTAVLVSCCCHVDVSHVNVYFLWNNGELYCTNVFSDGHFGDFYKVQTLQGLQKHLAMTTIDATHMAVAGVTKDEEVGIGIFDIKFGALQAWKQYPDKINKNVMLFCLHGHLITTCRDKIYACQFECQPSTIASVLGQKKVFSTQERSSMKTSLFSWDVESQKAEEKHPEPNITKLFTKLTDSTQTPTYDRFDKVFTKLKKIMKNDKNAYWLNSGHMTNLVQRCLTERKFWPRHEILWLIQQHCIGPSSVSSLFDALISRTEISMLHMALNTVLDVPEGCMCRSLKLFLGSSEEELNDLMKILPAQEDDCENTKPVLGPCKAYIVNFILILPYNDVFLLEWIKAINFENILLLLDHLCHLLSMQTQEIVNNSMANKKLTVPKIIDWISLIIDGHMTQFVLSPDARETILKLHQIVEEQTRIAKELVSLEAILEQLKAQSAIPKRHMTGQYCIEVLHVY